MQLYSGMVYAVALYLFITSRYFTKMAEHTFKQTVMLNCRWILVCRCQRSWWNWMAKSKNLHTKLRIFSLCLVERLWFVFCVWWFVSTGKDTDWNGKSSERSRFSLSASCRSLSGNETGLLWDFANDINSYLLLTSLDLYIAQGTFTAVLLIIFNHSYCKYFS